MKKKWMPVAVFAILTCCFVGLIVFGNRAKRNLVNRSRPDRIVSLSPNLTELVYALELGDRLIGVSSDSDWPADARHKTKVGTFWQPSIEAIIVCKPNLVIAESFEQQRAIGESLTRLGYNVLVLKMEKTSELLEATIELGEAAGCQKLARDLVEQIKSRLAALKATYSSRSPIRVLWVVQPEPLRVAGRATFVSELITLAGGENAISETMQQYPQLDTEQLLSCRAEVIIQSAMGQQDLEKQQQAANAFWARWPSLPAVQNNRIYVIRPDTVLRLGPRLPEGAELIARCLWNQSNDVRVR